MLWGLGEFFFWLSWKWVFFKFHYFKLVTNSFHDNQAIETHLNLHDK